MNLKAHAKTLCLGAAVIVATLPVLQRNLTALSHIRALATAPITTKQDEVACLSDQTVPCACADANRCRLEGTTALMTNRGDAQSCFERALTLDRLDAVSAFRLGQLHEACGRTDAAVEAYRRVPGIEQVRIRNSQAASSSGDCVRAAHEAQIATTITPLSPDAHYQVGMVAAYCDPRDYPTAIGAFEKAAALGYHDPYVWTRVAHAQAMAGQPTLAQETLKAHAQNNALARAIEGEALMTMGRYAEAATALSAATSGEPGNPWFWTSLGHALWAAGDPTGARAAWERALAIDRRFGPAIGALAQHP